MSRWLNPGRTEIHLVPLYWRLWLYLNHLLEWAFQLFPWFCCYTNLAHAFWYKYEFSLVKFYTFVFSTFPGSHCRHTLLNEVPWTPWLIMQVRRTSSQPLDPIFLLLPTASWSSAVSQWEKSKVGSEFETQLRFLSPLLLPMSHCDMLGCVFQVKWLPERLIEAHPWQLRYRTNSQHVILIARQVPEHPRNQMLAFQLPDLWKLRRYTVKFFEH